MVNGPRVVLERDSSGLLSLTSRHSPAHWLPVATSHWRLLMQGFSTHHGVNIHFSNSIKHLFIEPEQPSCVLRRLTCWTLSKRCSSLLKHIGLLHMEAGPVLALEQSAEGRGLRVLFVFLCQTSSKIAGLPAGSGK